MGKGVTRLFNSQWMMSMVLRLTPCPVAKSITSPSLSHLNRPQLVNTAFMRFHAVCKRWCSSAPLSDPPLQFPWLLECGPTPGYAQDSSLEEELWFYSLSTGETGVLPVKQSHHGKCFQGPCSGYLILLWESGSRISLWNPLTNVDISFSTPYSFSPYLWPVWTGSDPILSRHIVVVERHYALLNEIGCWVVYQPGNTEGKTMEGYFYNCCYWDGMFFSTRGKENTQVFDATSQKLLHEIPCPEDNDSPRPRVYLVEISGVIMRVCMYLDWNEDVEESVFHVYELHFGEVNQKPYWVKVSDIGNHILFLDRTMGFSMKPVAGFKGNCIYFMKRDGQTPCRYDIAADTFQRVSCPFEACTWFLPSLS